MGWINGQCVGGSVTRAAIGRTYSATGICISANAGRGDIYRDGTSSACGNGSARKMDVVHARNDARREGATAARTGGRCSGGYHCAGEGIREGNSIKGVILVGVGNCEGQG